MAGMSSSKQVIFSFILYADGTVSGQMVGQRPEAIAETMRLIADGIESGEVSLAVLDG